MPQVTQFDAWSAGKAYDTYMGRWSRLIADDFLNWVDPEPGLDWLDVGCGTGALTGAIVNRCQPRSVCAVDPSEGFVAYAASRIPDPRASFKTGNGSSLAFDDARFGALASGLVLNFIDNQQAALREFQRVLEPGGLLSFYVWDYPGGGMGLIDAFWTAAQSLDPDAARLNESRRFPTCTRDGILDLCVSAELADPVITAIEQVSEFPDFDAFWLPFTLGAGPAPGYCKNLQEDRRAALIDELRTRLGGKGPIRLPARAWAVKTRVPG